jgi:hypothetical protein
MQGTAHSARTEHAREPEMHERSTDHRLPFTPLEMLFILFRRILAYFISHPDSTWKSGESGASRISTHNGKQIGKRTFFFK